MLRALGIFRRRRKQCAFLLLLLEFESSHLLFEVLTLQQTLAFMFKSLLLNALIETRRSLSAYMVEGRIRKWDTYGIDVGEIRIKPRGLSRTR